MTQPPPTPGQQNVAEVVVESLERLLTASRQEALWGRLSGWLLDRIQAGFERYGTLLQTRNGRDPLKDAWEEAVDLTMYLHQAKLEGEACYAQVMQAENLLCSLTQMLMMREETP
jgi:hypothetical protein